MLKSKLFIFSQKIAPQHFLSRMAGLLANAEIFFIKNIFIRFFAAHFKVNMKEALQEDLSNYKSFNAFFTRALKPDARPICSSPASIACPADGTISEIGYITQSRLLQAKNHTYSTQDLLGGSPEDAKLFENGAFVTVYLSPKDYHRVHMPLRGTLSKMIFVPGDLFSVNHTTAQNIPNLFARNERVVCFFQTQWGSMAVILVGAMIVASIETVWAGIIAPHKKGRAIDTTLYSTQESHSITLEKGDELGRFLLGSTAIVLLPHHCAQWTSHLQAGSAVKMGEPLGEIITTPH